MEESKEESVAVKEPAKVVKKEDSLADKLNEAMEILKLRLAALKEQNQAIFDRCKAQAEKSKKAVVSFYEKTTAKFKKEKRPRIIMFETAEGEFCVKGDVSAAPFGRLLIEGSEMGEYSLVDGTWAPTRFLGDIKVRQENIILVSHV